MNERQYDNINNEGGEGYNPYRQARKRKEHEAAVEWSKTREGRKDHLNRMIERKDCSIARECGTYNQAEIDDLRAQLLTIEAEETAEFISAWPLDITKERRIRWNAQVRAGEITDTRSLIQTEIAQGWRLDQLKKAVKYHNL